MSLDAAGLGFAVIAELRTILKSIQERKSCYKEAPLLFAEVDETLSRLMRVVEDISAAAEANPDAVPQALHQSFNETLSNVKKSLLHADSTVKVYCDNAFFTSSTRKCFPTVANRCRRFVRSKKVRSSMASIQRDTRDAEGKLQHLQSQLCAGLKVNDLHDVIKEHVSPGESFRAAFNAPVLPGNTYLDFESKHEDGSFFAPEASLKSTVLISTSPRRVTVARGASRRYEHVRPVHGVSGMAGVGKTLALIGLGHDEDIQANFPDGVLYMSIGQNATVGHVTNELWKIMSVTGATSNAATVQSSKSFADAVAVASVWFHRKRVLFLIDDVWPTSSRPEGYLTELEGLLQGSPESRMAISTRSFEIAKKGGSHIDFGARDPCGATSLAIFLAHAFPDTTEDDCFLEPARPVLELCAGLPISLSVAGASVASCLDTSNDFEDACRTYLQNIQDQISLHPGTSFLDNAISLSLQSMAKNRQRDDQKVQETYSMSELYISLSVLENQQFAPIPVLSRMWGISEARADNVCVSFKSMSLAKISTQSLDGRKQRGLTIHDLHLEFCRRRAARNGEKLWHRRLLDSHMTEHPSLTEAMGDSEGPLGWNMLEYVPRRWWEEGIPNREYIRKHLSRHLYCAGLLLELGSTVLDIRWMSVQGQTGGILGLKNDVNILQTAVEDQLKRGEISDPMPPIILISQLVTAIASELRFGERVIYHYFCSLLFGLGPTNEWIHRFLRKARESLPKPFLEPQLSFFQYPVDDQKFAIDLRVPSQEGFAYHSSDFSNCDKYCAAGSNQDVVVFDLENQRRLRWLRGHEKDVKVVKFSTDASKLISASLAGDIIVWNWKEAESPFLILRGHGGEVSCLSVKSDGSKLFSGSADGTVASWDMISGDLCDEYAYGAEVMCMSICPNSEVVAVGTKDGRLACRDWVSGRFVFKHDLLDRCAVSAIQFGMNGKMLVCGTERGAALVWWCSEWKMVGAVQVPGSLTRIATIVDGPDTLLGSSTGEIRYWKAGNEKLSKYKISSGHPVTGLSFRKGGLETAIGNTLGIADAYTGPMSNPDLDFTEALNNMLYDFSLSNDGTRAATSSHDSMVRIWNCDMGALVASYHAPTGGSRRLALSANGGKLASSSPNGKISIWNAEIPPTDNDVSLVVDDKTVHCVSFNQDESRLLVCLEEEVQIWSLESMQMIQHVPNFGYLDSTFSDDGRFVIVGSTMRATVWDLRAAETVFDTADQSMSRMSLPEAKRIIKTSGSCAHRVCPAILKDTALLSSYLTVDNFSKFAGSWVWPRDMEFREKSLVMKFAGQLEIFKMHE